MDFNLKLSDFTVEERTSIVSTSWISEDLLKKLPNPEQVKTGPREIKICTAKANVDLYEQRIEIIYSPDEIKGKAEDFMNLLNKQLDWLKANEVIINNTITKKLLELKNDAWLEIEEKEVTAAEFLERIKLESICFYDDSSFDLYYDDGDLFAGHTITVSISADRTSRDATIAG